MRPFSLRHLALVGLLTALCLMTSACDAFAKPPTIPSSSLSPTTTGDRVTLFPLSPGVPIPNRLVAGPDGNLWLTAYDRLPVPGRPDGRPIHDAIVRMTPAGVYTVFPLAWET